MKYHTFRLQIGHGPAGGYLAQVVLSPKGEAQAQLALDISHDDIAALNVYFSRSVAAGRHFAAEDDHEDDRAPRRSPPEELGARLFAALFQGKVLSLYERSLDLLEEEDAEIGLRLELMLDPLDPDLAAIQALPWELLRNPATSDFPALNPRQPIVRYLTVPLGTKAAGRPKPLRILAVAAKPWDEHPLDLERELRNLREAVGTNSGIKIVTPERPTLAALRKALLEQECHVLHFMGHGGSVPGQAERVLFLETENGDAEPVRGTDLVNKLAGCRTLELVVLNACDSAALPESASGAAGFEPFAGVANTLVLGGLPAVIAMQFPISNEAAIAFSRAFYEHFAAGDPVDAAVAEGRQAVHSAAPASFEWATPVLFLRSPAPERTQKRRLLLGVAVFVLVVLAVLSVLLFRQARASRVQALITEGADLGSHGNWPEARERFEAARKLAPQSAEVLSDLAGAEEKLGDIRAAEDHYRAAVALRPGSAEHQYNLGHFLNERRSYAEAYDVLQKAHRLDPSRSDTLGELAYAAAERGMLGRARLLLETALRLDPERPAFHRRLGELELNAGHPQAAIPHLQEARRYPMDEREQSETAALLVQAYDRLGDAASACNEVITFRRLDRRGITPWEPAVRAVATRRGCIPS